MTKRIRSLLAMLLAIVMIVGILPTVALAREAEPEVESAESDLPQANGMQVHTPYGLKLGSGKQATRGENRDLPKSYSSVTEGWITSVKNQTQYGQYGTCWAFGTMAPIDMIKNEMQVGSTGETATTDLDLSEYHLSYFNYSNSYDEHNLTSGDSSILDGESHVNVGGDGYKATLTMMRWIGAASEAESALAYSECSETSTIDPKYAYAYDVGHVTSVDWIEPTDMDTIKQYIMEYGAGMFGYYYSSSYEGVGGAYCYMNTSESDDYGPNHGVTVVGWDDDYSKSNFTGRSYNPVCQVD